MTLYNLYDDYVVQLDPILWDAGRVRGVRVHNEKRLALLGQLNTEIHGYVTEAQDVVPQELRPRKHYKRHPVDNPWPIEEVLLTLPVKTCTQCGLQGVTKTGHTSRKRDNPCYGQPIELRPGPVTEYNVVLPFNPGSDDQLKAYADRFHHKMPENWQTGEKTLGAKELQQFIDRYGTKHPVYQLAAKIRKVRKARGYAKNWIPDARGLLYGEFKHVPETFRLSQADHNFMNVSHRGDAPYAKELRSLLIPPEGYAIVEADSSSVEAVFTGIFMGSPDYIERARKGIHAAWALQTLGLEVTPDAIKRLKNPDDYEDFWRSQGHTPLELQILYETKKRTVHGVSYGMSKKMLHYSYPQFFPTEASAQHEIDDFYAFVPDLQQWHEDTRQWAHKHGYLQSPWGFKNYYYRVFTYDWKTKSYKFGDDAKAVIAFQPQHANAMFQRENIRLIDRLLRDRNLHQKWWMGAISHVHDSNGLFVPIDDVEKAASLLKEVMTRPVPQMQHVEIGVGLKYSTTSWGEMKGL